MWYLLALNLAARLSDGRERVHSDWSWRSEGAGSGPVGSKFMEARELFPGRFRALVDGSSGVTSPPFGVKWHELESLFCHF